MTDQHTVDGPPAESLPRPVDAARRRLIGAISPGSASRSSSSLPRPPSPGWFFGFRAEPGDRRRRGGSTSWFAPYVDVTATPQYAFEDVTASAPPRRCWPSWSAPPTRPANPVGVGRTRWPAAADGLDLDRRVARLRQLGGDGDGVVRRRRELGTEHRLHRPRALTAAYSPSSTATRCRRSTWTSRARWRRRRR